MLSQQWLCAAPIQWCICAGLHMFSTLQACSIFSRLSTISRVFCLYYFLIQGLASDRIPLRLTFPDSLVAGFLPVWRLVLHLNSTLFFFFSFSVFPIMPPKWLQAVLTAQGSVSNIFLYIEALVAHTYFLSLSILARLPNLISAIYCIFHHHMAT